MKKYVLVCLLAILAWTAKAQDSDLIKVGDTMPSFTIVSDDGAELSSSSLKGKVVLICLFATWCPPCQKELPAIENMIWAKYKDNDKFSLLVIGREHTDADLRKYNEKKGFTFPLYPDKNRAVYGAFANNMIPRTFVIGKNGKVLHSSVGYTEEEFAELTKKVEDALK